MAANDPHANANPHAVRLGVGSVGFIVAFVFIGLAPGGWLWVGVAWLICGAICTAVMLVFRASMDLEDLRASDWVALVGWGGLPLFAMVAYAFLGDGG